jgi:hypothetical protein
MQASRQATSTQSRAPSDGKPKIPGPAHPLWRREPLPWHERVHDLWQSASSVPPLGERLSAVSQFAAELRRVGPANFLYADGDALFAHGHRRIQAATGEIAPPGLFVLYRRRNERDGRIDAHGVGVGSGHQEVVLIASVLLSDEKWRALDEGEVIAVAGGQVISRRSLQRMTSAPVHACGD